MRRGRKEDDVKDPTYRPLFYLNATSDAHDFSMNGIKYKVAKAHTTVHEAYLASWSPNWRAAFGVRLWGK